MSLKIPKGGNQNPYFEEEQTAQWPKEKVQKDKQDRVIRTPLKTMIWDDIVKCISSWCR